MGGGDDPDVDVHRPLAADADHLAVLYDAQQAHLGSGRQLADFVEEERASFACSNQPLRRVTAPVNAPGSWPNSSESMSSGEIAPQLTRRNGPSRNVGMLVDGAGDDLFPVPVSPNNRTGALLLATIVARAMTAARPVSAPISRSSLDRAPPWIRCSGRAAGRTAPRCFCDI